MSEFLDSLDIANLTCQLCGVTQIKLPTEVSKNNAQITFAYGKVRRAELRRNTWVFSIRKSVLRPVDVDTMLVTPSLWSSAKTYSNRELVADANKQIWISQKGANVNNAPGGNNEAWDMYFGPLTAEPYDTTGTTAYYAGELVYKPGSYPGSYKLFMSLVNNNSDVPDVATAWSATVTYHSDAVVSYLGSQYRSTAEVNLNITPFDGSVFLPFDIAATYAIGNEVTGSDNQLYTSVGSGNVGHDPTTDGGVHWIATGITNAWTKLSTTATVHSTNWRVIPATLQTLVFSYPVGAGPASQSETRNVYRIPAGFLKTAPQDPKAGSSSFLGAPTGLQYEPRNPEGNFIVSEVMSSDPIILRFVADVTKVTDMDDLFCKGLACSIATVVCETLTQSTTKLTTIASEYKLFMGEARLANFIEAGPVESPLDEFITCRT